MDNAYDSIPLFNFSRDPEIISKSTIGIYMCPNDISILAFTGDIELNELVTAAILPAETSSTEILNKKCLVSGYPKYIYPGMRPDKRKITQKTIYKTFYKFREQINSFGTISHSTETISQIKCSTTSGMSGSPLLVCDCDNPCFSDLKIAGLYNGGHTSSDSI